MLEKSRNVPGKLLALVIDYYERELANLEKTKSPKDVLVYKQFTGSIEISLKAGCLYGRIQDVYNGFCYEAQTLHELEKAFQEAVDKYKELNGLKD